MKMLITGAAGFIGSHFVRHLLASSDVEVVVLDALTYAGNPRNLAMFEDNPRYSFVHGDVCDRQAVRTAMAGCKMVVHFAAESHVDRSITSPDEFVRTNCVGTNVICDTARHLDVERVLHVSTDEVYGSIDEGSFAESDPLAPRSPYSASKAGSDLIALSYLSTHGLPVIVTRSSNNYGPHQHPEKVIPRFVTNLLDGLKVPLYGDGLNIRDWIFVQDNCRGLMEVLGKGVPGEIYNIGGHHELTNHDLTMKILERCGRDESFIDYVDDRLGHDRRYSVDMTKVGSLGWAPTTSFEDGLDRTISWYEENRNWWEPLKATPTPGLR